MKYFSETLHKNFDTEKECLEAEKAAEEKKTQREKDAAAVKKLQDKYLDAYNAYCKGVEEFVDKYGNYKTTYESKNIPSLRSPFDRMLRDIILFDF